MIVIVKIVLSFLFCIIYPVFLEKQVSNQKKHIFYRIMYRVINQVPIQKKDLGEVQEEIKEIQEPDRERNRQEKSRMVCTTRLTKELR